MPVKAFPVPGPASQPAGCGISNQSYRIIMKKHIYIKILTAALTAAATVNAAIPAVITAPTAVTAPTASVIPSTDTPNVAVTAAAESQIIDAGALAGEVPPANGVEVAVRGYIAGVVEGTSWSTDCSFAPPFDIASNLILAPVFPDGMADMADFPDPAVCVPVALPAGEIRSALSPAVNSTVYGREVVIYGVNTVYYGVSGLKEVNGYSFTGSDHEEEPPSDDTMRGTREAPLDVATFRSVFEQERIIEDCWLKGIIVGYVASTGADSAVLGHSGEGAAVGNLLVADDAAAGGTAECVAVQLPKGSVREALNLADNPENLGCRITAHGTREIYCDMPGLKHTDTFTLERKDPGGVAGIPGAETEGVRYYRPDGTPADASVLRPGIYIAVGSDGRAAKVAVVNK